MRVPGSRAHLDVQVDAYRQRLLENAQLTTARLQEKHADLTAQLAACTGRAHIHSATQLQSELQVVNADLAALTAGTRLTQFEQLTVELYDRLNRCAPAAVDTIIEEYWALLEGQPAPLHPMVRAECEECGVPLQITQEAHIACPRCGAAEVYLDATSSSMAYGEEVGFTQFHYKRETHFKENLNTLQAKESTHVSAETLDVILKAVLADYNLASPGDIDVSMVRPTLKRLDAGERASGRMAVNFHRLYDHHMLIYTRLSGKAAPRFTPEQEANVIMLFQVIQPLFEKHCPKERKNFMNYNYCTFKFCQRLNYTEFLAFFPLLKCTDKLKRQDDIMRAIFRDLGWEWIPTIKKETVFNRPCLPVPKPPCPDNPTKKQKTGPGPTAKK